MEQVKVRQENHCLNVVKGLASIMVVFGHAIFPGTFGQMVFTLASAGVPIFFLISGYYAYYEDSQIIAKKVPKKLFNISKVTLEACLLYFVWKFVYTGLKGDNLLSAMKEFRLKKIATLLVLNDTDVISGSHLWFLFCLIYAYMLLWFLAKHNIVKWIYPVVILAFVARLFACHQENWHYMQNFWVDGLPYFFTGFYLNKQKEKISKISSKVAILVIILGIVWREMMYFINLPVAIPINLFEIGSIIAAIMVFIVAHNNGDKGKNSVMEKIGKDYSLYLYIGHVMIFYFISIYDKQLFGGELPVWYEWVKPLLVLIISLGVAVVYSKISTKKK